jgi:myo-inositol-1(or 4)-monophosphatase
MALLYGGGGMTETGQAVDRGEALLWAKELAAEAVARAVKMVACELVTELKVDGSLVTNVDRTIEQFLRDAIRERYPAHAILGEEYGYDGSPGVPLWAIDPIDGTTNLTHGLPLWGVSVGLVVGDTPVAGVVALPLLGETYAAARGLGATRNDAPLPVLPPGGPSHWEDTYAICSTSARVVDFTRIAARLRVLGSAALELCWTAAGRVRGCQSISTSLYDIAAGVCIAHEAGATTEWLSGEAWSAAEMARSGARGEVLLTAPPATLAFLRQNLKHR